MLRRLLPALMFGALPLAVDTPALPEAAIVGVTLRPRTCAVAPSTVDAGAVVFRIANRSGTTGSFEVAGRRSRSIRPGASAVLRLELSPGRHGFRCRPRGSGRIGVRGPAAEHRIGVRLVEGTGELYDRVTGTRFVPRGANYIRLSPSRLPSGEPITAHDTFTIGRYDAARAEQALARMQAGGFNAVRVFLGTECADGCAIDRGTGLVSPAYAANLDDFLRRAKAHGVFVIVTIGFLTHGRYAQLIDSGGGLQVADVNLNYLTSGGVAGNAEFWRDLAEELVRQRAALDAVLAYDLRNEINLVSNAPPFTLSSGTFRAANGRSYDLASAADKALLIDESLLHYVERVRAAIREVDPTALVAASFFQPQEPNRSRVGDIRIIRTRAVIEQSVADFVDLHPYPGIELSLAQYMENFGVAGPSQKPVIMGEYGAFRFAYASAAAAARALQGWESESCRYGFDGWLIWTWDTDEQPELWNALSDGGTIERALAPRNRPDPCAPPAGATDM